MDEPIADLDEIRALSAHLPGPDLEAGTLAATRQTQLTKPAGALGRLEELAIWLATWQARHPPRLDHPRTLVFAGNHGVAARGVSAYPASVTAQMVQNFIAGGAAINQLCRVFDAGLKVYEMNLDTPTGDIAFEPFAGSGTQIIAAERINRTCYAVEINPAYCDVILERWRRVTGQEAKRDGRAKAKADRAA